MCEGAGEPRLPLNALLSSPPGLPAFICIPCQQGKDGPELTPPNTLHLPASL